jgi:RNA polymerase sigma-70 factor (ECF subfamily)
MAQLLDENTIPLLAEQIKQGDESAFEELFFRMQPNIFRFLYRFNSNREIAEDLTQETFIRFWQSREKLDSGLSPVAYLYRIARNLSLNYSRDEKSTEPIGAATDYLISFFTNPEKEFEDSCLVDDFQKAIMTLPKRCREVFILSRYHDMSYSEIAETLEIALQTVKNQMNKAIAILRKRLSDYLE